MKEKRKIFLSILLIATMLLQIFGYAMFSGETLMVHAAQGLGTPEDPYQISTVEDLRNISGQYDKHFILVSDIDMEGVDDFSPLGSWSTPFTGTLDGNGYKIKNFKMDSEAIYIALFAYAKNAVIKNLVMENTDVTGERYVAGLVGVAIDSTIENCSVQGSFQGHDYIGALVGNARGATKVKNCTADATVTGDNFLGLIVGEFRSLRVSGGRISSIEGCYGSGSVHGKYQVGGITGYLNAEGGLGLLQNNSMRGQVSGIDYVGGIAGYVQNGDMNYNYNEADVTGRNYVGGLVGLIWEDAAISESFNLGDVTGSGSTGGIAGDASGNEIINSYNCGDVTGSGSTGGIAGSAALEITNCYNTGNVSGGRFVGGISGDIYNYLISNCVVMNGNIYGSDSNYLGRIVGYMNGEHSSNNHAYDDMAVHVNDTIWDVKNMNPETVSKHGQNTVGTDLLIEDFYRTTLNWDMDHVWVMPSEGEGFPVLRNIDVRVLEN